MRIEMPGYKELDLNYLLLDYKRNVIDELGGEYCVCLGNGRNDVRMFEAAALSIGIMEREGIYGGLLQIADLCLNST